MMCRYVVSFLNEHGKEVYIEVRAAYIDTMNKVNAIESTVNLRIKFCLHYTIQIHLYGYFKYCSLVFFKPFNGWCSDLWFLFSYLISFGIQHVVHVTDYLSFVHMSAPMVFDHCIHVLHMYVRIPSLTANPVLKFQGDQVKVISEMHAKQVYFAGFKCTFPCIYSSFRKIAIGYSDIQRFDWC